MTASATYLNFDLLITRAGDQYRAYVIDAPGGDADVTFALPFAADTLGPLARGTGIRRHVHLKQESVAEPADLRELGTRLYDAVFRDEVRSVLVASQREAEAAQQHLRIRLRFSNDAVELATLPWEILFDPEQEHFLALSEARPILRYLPLPRPRPALKVEPPLSILAVLASPADHVPLDVEQEWQAMETALADLQADDKVRLERLATPTLDALQQRLMGELVHVLHFVGHGIYEPDRGESMLLFEDPAGDAQLVAAENLARLFHNHSSLHLVYLNACEGAIGDESNAFAGVAQSLVQQGVPAAVAMQDEITDRAATELARTFYTALATGRPVDSALTHARVALAAHGNDEWAIPVLFSRSPDNHLFDAVDVLPSPDCPYPGMRPFGEKQADLFFGREQEISTAIQRLALHPFLTVVGPSGSGKSSLVYAGILPALKRDSHHFGGDDWILKDLRPGEEPATRLAHALGTPSDDPAALPTPEEPEGKNILLIVDQFEEIFTLADADKERADEVVRFLAALVDLIDAPNLYILLTVRADFYSEMMSMGPLWEEIKANRLELTPLGDDELWAAIVQPAAQVGVSVDEALAVQLIADASGEAGVLPLVQQTLVSLWDKVEKRQLGLTAYREMARGERSGLQVAIDQRAELVYGKLPDPAKPIARRIFLRLIQFGESRTDTRRQQTVAELRARGDDPDLFDQTLRTLVDSRLLTTSGEIEVRAEEEAPENADADASAASRRVDIAHEALIDGWGKLRGWRNEEREFYLWQQRLDERQQEWAAQNNRDSGTLLRGGPLTEAEEWLGRRGDDLSQEEKEFIQASRHAMWMSRIFIGGSVVVVTAIVAVVTTLALTGQIPRLIYRPLPMAWVEIPAGQFTMGSSNEEIETASTITPNDLGPGESYILFDEQPPHSVFLDTYEIGRYEVTNRQYRQCVLSTECSPPNNERYRNDDFNNYPVTDVNWNQAQTFCQRAARRLPTEAQWEKAARGGPASVGRLYPWGDEPDPQKANVHDEDIVQPIGHYPPVCDGCYEVEDMIGNVWEWVFDLYADDYYEEYVESPSDNPEGADEGSRHVFKGGSYDNDWILARPAYRNNELRTGDSAEDVGFRCVR